MRQDPWGEFRSPELDEFIRQVRLYKNKFQAKFKLPGWWVILLVILILWLLSGVYFVKPEQAGVVQRFGAYVHTTGPGPHWHLPFPIEKVTKPQVEKIQRLEIGFRTIRVGPPAQYRSVPEESLMLTGDENIVKLEFIVQYKIKDPVDYLFQVYDPLATVKLAAEAAMREVIGKNKIDEALTTGKGQIQDGTKVLLQEILDIYQAGVHIVAVQLQDVHPPDQVMQAFRDVASAKEDKIRMINESEGYRNEIVPMARGEAAKNIKEAEGYKAARIERAKGDAERFTKLLVEYRRAPEVTRKRVYLEALEEVLPNIEKYVLEGDFGKSVLPYLPLERKPRGRSETP